MKLEYLKEFLVLVETVNYSVAADELYISVSSLSRHIMLLESELGVELFERGARIVSITNAGKLLVPYAKKIIATEAEYLEVLAEQCGIVRQELTLGFSRPIIQYGIINLLTLFREKNPDISVVFTGNDPLTLLRMVRSGDCNFALCSDYPFSDKTGLMSLTLIKDSLAIAFPASHPLAENEKVSFTQLKDESFILSQRKSAAFRNAIELFKEFDLHPKVVTYSEGGELMLNLVSQGAGIALTTVQRFLEVCPPDVKIVEIDPRLERSVKLFFRNGDLNDPEKRFYSFMQEYFQEST